MGLISGSRQVLRKIISPQQYDFWAAELGSIAAWDRCFARVLRVEPEALDTVSITLKPNRNFPGYLAGQHMNLSADINGRRVTRCYSFTSCPDTHGAISFSVRRDPNGMMSQWLCDQLQPGSIVEITGVFGELTLETLQARPTDKLVMLAAGSGITPMLSLLRALSAREHRGPLTLLYWERSAASFCFTRELDSLCERHPNLRIQRLTTDRRGGTDDHTGRISAEQLARLLGPADEHSKPIVLACGSAGFVSSAQALMQPRAGQFHAEAFSPPAPSRDEPSQHFQLELLRSGRSLTVSNQQTLLEALEAEGVAVESGCRMGICNTCVCQASGSTRDSTTGLQHNGGATRLCVSRASSDLQLDL